MKTIEDLEQEYKKYIVNREEIKDSMDAFKYVSEEIEDIEEVWDHIQDNRRKNDYEIKAIKLNNRLHDKFKRIAPEMFKIKDASYYNKDNLVLLESAQLVINNLEYFEMIRDLINDENYLELTKLAAFLNIYFDENLAFLAHNRDMLDMEEIGIILYDNGPEYNGKVVDEFAKQKISSMNSQKKVYTK